jgi:peptidoglycan/xylan/chitin deacetylase (PgdA/CDA1 family)
VSPAGQLAKGAFVISIDTEMAWGLNHRPERPYRYDDERRHLDRLLELFDRHDIPATWAVVGHLMLDRCEPVGGVKHPEIVRSELEGPAGDWFDADPCTDAERDPTWYAPDLIERIRSASAAHEIGSHGFSHIRASDPGCSRETFDAELRAAVAAAAARGVTLRSLIYPRNGVGHVDVLVEHGILAYRGRRPSPARPGTIWDRAIDRTVGSERTAVRPVSEDGIWNFPATILYDVDIRPRTWRLWIRQVERRLDQAVERRSLFHLWFHPHNLRDRTEAAFEGLERLCRAAADHRRRGGLDTVTMGALAEQLPATTTS